MGNLCGGGNPDDFGPSSEEKRSNKNVNAEMGKRKKEMKREVKLLLLGSGESGKSTIFKQVRKIHNDFEVSQAELNQYRSAIYANIIHTIKMLAESCIKQGIPFDSPEQMDRAKLIIDLAESDSALLLNCQNHYTPEIADCIEKLWKDKAIKGMFEKRYDYHIFDGAIYFFNNLERLRPPNYVPTFEDMLRCRKKTTGVTEIEFSYEKLHFKLVDVGGQRNERRKWIHCFESVSAVIFVASLSDYDQKCYEDDVTNRMVESLELFDEIVNGKYFNGTTIILFLNKTDVFREKIKKIDLKECFEEYDGGCDFDNASNFIRQKFLDVNKFDPQRIYIHFTCATNTEAIKTVFETLKNVIVKKNLEESGMI